MYALYENIPNTDDRRVYKTKGVSLDGVVVTSSDNIYDSYVETCNMKGMSTMELVLSTLHYVYKLFTTRFNMDTTANTIIDTTVGSGSDWSGIELHKEHKQSFPLDIGKCFDFDIIYSLMWYRLPGVGPAVEPIVGYLTADVAIQAELVIYIKF